MCNRIQHIIDFWHDMYPDYFEIGVRAVSPEERANLDMFFHRNTQDIVFASLNMQMSCCLWLTRCISQMAVFAVVYKYVSTMMQSCGRGAN